MKTLRHVKIQETGDHYRIRHESVGHSVPEIRLKGKWLKDVGFHAGELAEIIIADDLIVITRKKGDES